MKNYRWRQLLTNRTKCLKKRYWFLKDYEAGGGTKSPEGARGVISSEFALEGAISLVNPPWKKIFLFFRGADRMGGAKSLEHSYSSLIIGAMGHNWEGRSF